MAKNSVAGEWGAYGSRRAYAQEIANAKEISSEWLDSGIVVSIVLDELPGRVAPLWGSDDRWLYLRRPEGIWKTHIPDIRKAPRTFVLYQKSTVDMASQGMMGGSVIGLDSGPRGGWIRGTAVEEPLNVAEIDDEAAAAANLAGVDASALGHCLATILDGPEGMVVDGGEYFGVEPEFSLRGDWLVGRDKRTGRTVAYPLAADPAIRTAIAQRCLCMRFRGRWMKGFDVRVLISNA